VERSSRATVLFILPHYSLYRGHVPYITFQLSGNYDIAKKSRQEEMAKHRETVNINEESWSNPTNWRCKGNIYCSRMDSRLFVPKRVKWMGWTINFFHPWAFPAVFIFFLGIPLQVKFANKAIPVIMVAAVVIGSHIWRSLNLQRREKPTKQ
jgi:hypothetical protein